MRFIGNKTNLLTKIKEVVDENCNDGSEIFCDIFSGTGSVSRFFKPYYRIISNDLLYFSHILTASTIENNYEPQFEKLKTIGIEDPFAYLEMTDASTIHGFVTEEYSPVHRLPLHGTALPALKTAFPEIPSFQFLFV